MYTNIVISGLGISYPAENISVFDEWKEKYQKKGIRIASMMKMLGKDRSFRINKEDDYYTLLIEAAKNALADAKLTPNEIDMIVVVTEEPQFLTPTNALKVGSILDTQNLKVAYDMNANCAGGLVSLDQVCAYLKHNISCKNALVITAFYGSFITNGENPYYEMFSDSASAFVLERKEEETKRGFLDSTYKIDCNYIDGHVFPNAGMKDLILNHCRTDEDIISINKASDDLDFTSRAWEEILRNILEKNDLQPRDIKKYLFSQLNLYDLEKIGELLKLPEDKIEYIGNIYGYNGCCSPFFALKHAIENQTIETDDLVTFCALASGYQVVAILYKM